MTGTARVADLVFLVGAWRGEGTLRDAAVTCRSTGAPFGDGMLTLDHVTSRGGAVVHKERILFRDEADGGVLATTSPWRGEAQVWRVAAAEPGRVWTLTHPGFLWTIRRDDADHWSETFDRVPAGAPAGLRGPAGGAQRPPAPSVPERIVSLRHARDAAPAEVTP